jgi:hypothetical protein
MYYLHPYWVLRKHISLVIHKKRIIAVGFNHFKSHPKAKELGYTFDEMKLVVKQASGLEDKSFADCSKDDLMLAIEACIQIGREQFNLSLE